MCFLDSLFSLIVYCVCLLFIELSLSIRDKKGEILMKCENIWESCLFCLGRVEIVFDRGRYLLFLIGGDTFLFHGSLIYIHELFMIYVFVLCFVKSRIYFCFTCIFHTCVYAFVEYFRKYQVDSIVLLSILATDG